MARLFEYQSKQLLKDAGFKVPSGTLIHSREDVDRAFEQIGPGVLKAQVFTTGRAALGLIKFPETRKELMDMVTELLAKTLKDQKIELLLYEEKLLIEKEYYAGITIDSSKACPVLIFSAKGGSGIEEIALKSPESIFKLDIDLERLPRPFEIIEKLKQVGIRGKLLNTLTSCIINLARAAINCEARSLEVNPLILTKKGIPVAADCHMTIDDYAVFRHPEMCIEIAREFGHPPTELERIAYRVEKDDYRGTFYFIQMESGFKKGEGFVGFHGAGGGGSMMSMDALQSYGGYRAANFCDTSGNPPASKVYRASRIILSQPGIDGYFGSGSGVASQEQFHSARGLVKAFREVNPDIPVVVRLGGNSEEKAISILENYTEDLRAPIRCFGKDTPVTECARVFDGLVKSHKPSGKKPLIKPEHNSDYSFETVTGGTVSFDYNKCRACKNKICVTECAGKILALKDDVPVLNISREDAGRGKCSECLACEVECHAKGMCGGRINLPLEGL